MNVKDYQSNEQWPGGKLEFEEDARQTVQMIRKYDDGKLCGLCYYFDEQWKQMTKADFIAHFLKESDKWELIDPPCDCFEITIDQSNKPQTLLVRPKPTTIDRSRRLVRFFKRNFQRVLWKNAA